MHSDWLSFQVVEQLLVSTLAEVVIGLFGYAILELQVHPSEWYLLVTHATGLMGGVFKEYTIIVMVMLHINPMLGSEEPNGVCLAQSFIGRLSAQRCTCQYLKKCFTKLVTAMYYFLSKAGKQQPNFAHARECAISCFLGVSIAFLFNHLTHYWLGEGWRLDRAEEKDLKQRLKVAAVE